MNYEVEETADGTSTIYLPDLDEHYHSVKGAMAESCHIYRDCGLLYRLSQQPHLSRVNVLEIGFGTGLNAVVSALADTHGTAVNYASVELHPLSLEQVSKLNYGKFTDEDLYERLHKAEWGITTAITETFSLHKICDSFLTMQLPIDIDVVYFDAFAPEKQPEMWQPNQLRKVYDAMRSGAVLTTYCAKGAIRRMLQDIGFKVERIAGPVGGKREILRATKL
jgi:tRNA U34 5-methylaminomethyl-2-thiouridine-forming methyltransferase MnmC